MTEDEMIQKIEEDLETINNYITEGRCASIKYQMALALIRGCRDRGELNMVDDLIKEFRSVKDHKDFIELNDETSGFMQDCVSDFLADLK